MSLVQRLLNLLCFRITGILYQCFPASSKTHIKSPARRERSPPPALKTLPLSANEQEVTREHSTAAAMKNKYPDDSKFAPTNMMVPTTWPGQAGQASPVPRAISQSSKGSSCGNTRQTGAQTVAMNNEGDKTEQLISDLTGGFTPDEDVHGDEAELERRRRGDAQPQLVPFDIVLKKRIIPETRTLVVAGTCV